MIFFLLDMSLFFFLSLRNADDDVLTLQGACKGKCRVAQVGGCSLMGGGTNKGPEQ